MAKDLTQNNLRHLDSISILKEAPIATIELIKEIENSIREGQNTLFYDIRKEYIVPVAVDFISSEKSNKVAFIAYSIFNNEVEFFIKAFDYNAIRTIFMSIVEKFSEFDMLTQINHQKHIKWIKLEEIKVQDRIREESSNSERLLKGTIESGDIYPDILKKLSEKGYIEREYKENLRRNMSKGKYENLLKLLDKTLLLSVENDKITILHQSIPRSVKEDDLKTVYTFEPRLWQYYVNEWFEDFVGKAIEEIKNEAEYDIEIVNFEGGAEYNFKENSLDDDKVQIDWVVLLKKNNKYKLVAIECKRTMGKSNKKKIEEKYTNKITTTPNHHVIDAYINVGYFSSVILPLDEKLSTKSGYSWPFLTIAATQFEEMIKELKRCFENIMDDCEDAKFKNALVESLAINLGV